MRDEIPVAVVDTCHDLLEVALRFLLRKLPLRCDHVVQITARNVLRNHEDVRVRVQHFVQTDDVLVIEESQQSNLSFNLDQSIS